MLFTLSLLSAPFIKGMYYKISCPHVWRAGLCDNTVTEWIIVIDVVLLQNLSILRCYWYCKNLILMTDIDIGIAKYSFWILILILVLHSLAF